MFVALFCCCYFSKSTSNKLNLLIDFYGEDGLLWNLPNHRPAQICQPASQTVWKNYMAAIRAEVKMIPLCCPAESSFPPLTDQLAHLTVTFPQTGHIKAKGQEDR